MPETRPHFVVVGSGLAGLTFALRASEYADITVVTKAEVKEANTSYAQGGIAAAVGEADSWELHEQDTLIAGAGLCDPDAVRFLVQEAPAAIRWLQGLGANFDLETDGDYALGREGGHSRNRILHRADRTGWELENAVVSAVRKQPRIQVVEHTFVTRLAIVEGECRGAFAEVAGLGPRFFSADAVMLATGGAGMLFSHTTNPRVATADGIALAHEARAVIADMEFMQFHPTTLYHPQHRSFLITEAARGAGGTLRNHRGTRFMYDYDARLELAPRDIVARAMDAEMKKLETWCLYLDLAHLDAERTLHEFPTIAEKLSKIGIDIKKDWIPVVPAQHYSCGGVKTDLQGRTSIPRLYAAGEVACTGVHGANRLASNSLLEAIVFSTSAARDAEVLPARPPIEEEQPSPKCPPEAATVGLRKRLQHLMTDKVGIVRTNAGLAEARKGVEALRNEFDKESTAKFTVYGQETRNLLITAEIVVNSAIARQENVGLHFNSDLLGATPRS